MHYWNRDNFKGLADLAIELATDPRLADLARYCELREQGLRSEAFAALDRFLVTALTSDAATQRDLVLRILDAHSRTPEAHQFLAHPLQHRLVEPVLTAWSEAEPKAATPVVELALLRGDYPMLDRALRIRPTDDRVRTRLVSKLISDLDYATHHLVEGRLIGTTEDAMDTLVEAEQFLRAAAEPAGMQRLADEVAEFRQLLTDWAEYRQNPTGSFPEYCKARGRTYRWWSIVYYDR